MNPKAYFCRNTGVGGCGTEVPLDHWRGLQCPHPPMPLGWIIGIIEDQAGDSTHAEGNITATRLFDCPRKVLIEDFVGPAAPRGGLVFDPTRMNSARAGTVIHADIAKHTPGGGYHEIRFPLDGQEPPVLDLGGGVQVPISGGVDYIEPNIVCIEEYKTHSESAHKFKWNRKAADPEVRAQVGIYKTLIERALAGVRVEKARIWHGAMTSAKHPAPPWFDIEVDPMTLQEVGDMRPFGAKQTVRDIAAMYLWALAKIREIPATRETPEWYAAFDSIVNTLPMVGETQFGGEKCLTYCGAAQPYCFGCAGRKGLL